MNNFLSKKLATNIILVILSLMVLFHLLILMGLVPYEKVWGGKFKTDSQMIFFETTSILLYAVMLLVVCINAGILKLKLPRALLKIALWTMVGLFFMNTLGNTFSHNELEKLIFTPLTFVLTFCSLRLALDPEQEDTF